MDIKDWKKRLSDLLKEHPDIDTKFTGQVEINVSVGGVTKVYTVGNTASSGGSVRVTTKQELM